MACRSLAIVAAAASFASSAQAQWVQIDFDSVPLGLNSVPTDFYAGSGLASLHLHDVDPSVFDIELSGVETPGGLPSPAGGRGIAPLVTLLGIVHPFEFVFSTPIDAFSIHAFYAHPEVSITGYLQNTLVAQHAYSAQAGRLHLHLELGAVGGAHFDRVLIGVSPGAPALDPNAGPRHFDALSYHIIPSPATTLLLVGGLAVWRRRRGIHWQDGSA